LWSSFGNITGLFLLSLASTLGLGAILGTSATLFGALKIIGALYLFYVGYRHMFGQSKVFRGLRQIAGARKRVERRVLYVEALLLAATNPKPILFFTALFPQFVNTHAALIPQFLTLTGIFMVLSFTTLVGYSIVAARAAGLLQTPAFAVWVDRGVGAVFMSFGVALLTIRRRAT
jgi:homoserine/homoserine lactone efflux protein